jgi:iron-sulfur cluster assembly protein
MIEISPTAAQEIKRIKENRQLSEHPLHLRVKPGGCCQFVYDFQFQDNPQFQVYESNGVKLAIAPEHLSYLQNLKIDYSFDLMGGAFRFDNPNAVATCSCSQSFSIDENI